MNFQTHREIRLGLIALVLSAIVLALGTILRGPISLTDPASFIRNADTTTYMLAWALILIGGVLSLYGSFGLYRYLTSQAEGPIAFWAFMLRLGGIALFLPFAGFFAVNGPVIAKLYQHGNQEVIAVVNSNFSGLGLTFFGLSGVGEIMGWILFTVALWQDGRSPKWAVVLFLLALLFIVIPVTNATELLGWVLLLISASMIAWKGWHDQ
jgi:hypothetical protein